MTTSRTHGDYYSDEVSLLDLWLILREEWRILAGAIAIGVTIAVVAAFIMTPVYRAETVIAEIETGGGRDSAASSLLGQLGGLANIAGVNLRGLGASQNDGRTILQSRTFIERFIEEQGLMPLLYADIWDAQNQSWNPAVERPPATWQGARRFMSDVFYLDEDNETGLLTVAIEWPDPKLAAHWANRLVELLNETARERDIADAESSIAYLSEQIEQTNVVELQRVLYNLVEAELQTLTLANAHKDYAFQVVDAAVVPVSAAKPKRLFLVILGILAGGFLGLILVFLRSVARSLKEQASVEEPPTRTAG